MSGFVSFIGSGPGDPELLTLKAVDRMQKADAVLFDDLSSGPILSHRAPDADLVGVGKRAGRPSPKQYHVSRLLVEYAQTGQRVVRLKSGDGGMFGRLEEEIVALRAAGIDYEIIPGIPSAIAAAAAAGIPLTRRLTARRVQFVTGHDVSGQLPPDLNLTALAMRRRPPLCSWANGPSAAGRDPARQRPAAGHARSHGGIRFHTGSEAAPFNHWRTGRTLKSEIGTAPALILYGPLAEFEDV